jgi:ketosteroid isomerase-like protein
MRGVAKALHVCARVSAVGLIACAQAVQVSQGAAGRSVAAVRAELVGLYEENSEAYMRGDLAAVMRLRAPDFHALTPDGLRRDRAAMEQYMQGVMNGIQKWNSLTFTIDSLQVVNDTAFAIVRQHLDRMALRPDSKVHHVETWVTQRETWVRHGGVLLMWRVDDLRDQRRLVDGAPE